MAGYGTDQGFTDWLADNGYVLPVDAPDPAVLRQRGSAYVDGLYGTQDTTRLRFPGVPTGGVAQDRAWPRSDAYIFMTLIDPAAIPAAVVEASYFAGLQEATSPGILTASAAAASQIKREKVGPLETEYFAAADTAASAAMTTFSFIEGLLAPLLLPPLPAMIGLRAIGC
jgi:hypothetical protein